MHEMLPGSRSWRDEIGGEMSGKSILQRVFNALQLSVDHGVNCELTPRQCQELLQREKLLQDIADRYQDEIIKLRRLLELERSDE